MKKCKFCAEEIQDVAIKCKHCGSMLNDETSVTEQVVCGQPPETITPKVKAEKESRLLNSRTFLSGEEIYFETRPSKAPMIAEIFMCGIVALIFASLGPAWRVWSISIFALVAFSKILKNTSTAYLLTNKRIMLRSGVFTESLIQVPLNKIQNAELKTVLSVIDIGHISFDTAGGPLKEIVWRNVPGPQKAFKIVSEIIHK